MVTYTRYIARYIVPTKYTAINKSQRAYKERSYVNIIDTDDSMLPNDIAASRCFAFDSISGKFVTKQMNFKFKKI